MFRYDWRLICVWNCHTNWPCPSSTSPCLTWIPGALSMTPDDLCDLSDLHLSPETYNQLRCLQKKARDLRQEMRKLRRLSQEHSLAVREMIGDTFSKIRWAMRVAWYFTWNSMVASNYWVARSCNLHPHLTTRIISVPEVLVLETNYVLSVLLLTQITELAIYKFR